MTIKESVLIFRIYNCFCYSNRLQIFASSIINIESKMGTEFRDISILIYLAGVFITGYKTSRALTGFKSLERQVNDPFFTRNKKLRRYLILKPLLWPYYFIIERSPLELISELFFKRYGDEGTIYFHNQGIINFFNDLLRGKDRYMNYKVNYVCWPVDKNSSYSHSISMNGKEMYAEIIFAQYKNQYLLGVIGTAKYSPCPDRGISRYQLDRCERVNETELKTKLQEINYQKANELFPNIS